jgi:anti-sigma regulatory factor (Ser/Thr protein kinase)
MASKSADIGTFIIENVGKHPRNIAPLVAKKFGISRQRAHTHVKRAVDSGILVRVGKTSSSQYFLVGGNHIRFELKRTPDLKEDWVWSKLLKPMFRELPANIYKICNYGFTEIFNNAIDHSEGTETYVEAKLDKDKIEIVIMDNGVGIFKKIQQALKLDSVQESLLHLSKGKFTTDPKNHTGQGIFFTSRAVDTFSIYSDDLYFSFKESEWFLSPEKREDFGKGTYIKMEISLKTSKTVKSVMDEYADTEIGFHKTIVAVALSSDPDDPHVSRSQAKRLLMGLEKFKTIVLDFAAVTDVGQAFADEVFRVFQNEYPDIKIVHLNTSKDVEEMIKRAIAERKSHGV